MDLTLKGVAAAASFLGAVVSTRHHANLIQRQFAECHRLWDYLAAWWGLDESSFLAVNTAALLIFVAALSGVIFVVTLVVRILKFLRKRKEQRLARENAAAPSPSAPARKRKKPRGPKPGATRPKKDPPKRVAS